VVDDWLAEQGGIDWLPSVEEEIESATARTRRSRDRAGRYGRSETAGHGREGNGDEARSAVSAVVRRRRVFLVLGLGVLVILAILLPLIPFGGSGGQQAVTAYSSDSASGQTGTRSQGNAAPPATAASRARAASKPLTVELPRSGLLHRGDAGAAVVTLQKALSAVGFDAGSPDGDFGVQTEAAVVGFQKANGLVPDGVVGKQTAAKLNAALAAR
jgi:hypothetical protein